MPSTDISDSLPLARNCKGFSEEVGDWPQHACPEPLPAGSPLEHTATRVFYGDGEDNADYVYITKDFATSAWSPYRHLESNSCVTTPPIKLQENTIQKIAKLAQTAGEDNWDEEGAIKVSPETIEVACKLVATFPQNVLREDLDIDATPLGSIDFGWVLERDVMMNIIVLQSREIGFAYSVHGDRGGGQESWEGTTIPHSLSEAFDKVFNRHVCGD